MTNLTLFLFSLSKAPKYPFQTLSNFFSGSGYTQIYIRIQDPIALESYVLIVRNFANCFKRTHNQSDIVRRTPESSIHTDIFLSQQVCKFDFNRTRCISNIANINHLHLAGNVVLCKLVGPCTWSKKGKRAVGICCFGGFLSRGPPCRGEGATGSFFFRSRSCVKDAVYTASRYRPPAGATLWPRAHNGASSLPPLVALGPSPR